MLLCPPLELLLKKTKLPFSSPRGWACCCERRPTGAGSDGAAGPCAAAVGWSCHEPAGAGAATGGRCGARPGGAAGGAGALGARCALCVLRGVRCAAMNSIKSVPARVLSRRAGHSLEAEREQFDKNQVKGAAGVSQCPGAGGVRPRGAARAVGQRLRELRVGPSPGTERREAVSPLAPPVGAHGESRTAVSMGARPKPRCVPRVRPGLGAVPQPSGMPDAKAPFSRGTAVLPAPRPLPRIAGTRPGCPVAPPIPSRPVGCCGPAKPRQRASDRSGQCAAAVPGGKWQRWVWGAARINLQFRFLRDASPPAVPPGSAGKLLRCGGRCPGWERPVSPPFFLPSLLALPRSARRARVAL